jgi:hypothetical protein
MTVHNMKGLPLRSIGMLRIVEIIVVILLWYETHEFESWQHENVYHL